MCIRDRLVDNAGVFEISFSASVKVPESFSSNTRQVPALYLTSTPDGGSESKIPGSINATYLRLPNTNQAGFSSFSNSVYVELTANSEIRLKIVWLDGQNREAELYTAEAIQNTISIRRIT